MDRRNFIKASVATVAAAMMPVPEGGVRPRIISAYENTLVGVGRTDVGQYVIGFDPPLKDVQEFDLRIEISKRS